MHYPLTFMLAAVASVTSSAQAISVADRAALEQLKDANDTAWNRRDVATIAGQYVSDATIRVGPDAQLVVGKQAIRDFFTASFARRDGEYRHVTQLVHLEPLDDTSALSEGAVAVEKRGSDGKWAPVRRFRTISIAVRTSGGWKLRSVRAIPLAQ